jgi:hypothetical protein
MKEEHRENRNGSKPIDLGAVTQWTILYRIAGNILPVSRTCKRANFTGYRIAASIEIRLPCGEPAK